MFKALAFLTACTALAGVSAQNGAYQQCGGQGWTGVTTCVSGYVCTVVSAPYYSQCLPGSGGGTTTPPSGGSGTTTTTATSGTATLQPGYSFIRGVESPYTHFYLQSAKVNTAGNAVLSSPSTAAQFQVTNGQLIQNAGGTNLYATVANRTDTSVMKLLMSWSTTPATAGTFVFSGDTLEWSIPTITRPQTNAWLICPDADGNNDVYINLGNYDYMTPAGCYDQTIHAYTGSTATP